MKNLFAKKVFGCAVAGVLLCVAVVFSACDDSSSAGGDETETSALSSAEGQEDVSSSSEKSSSSSSVKDTEPAEVSSSSVESSDSKSSSSVKSGDSSSSSSADKLESSSSKGEVPKSYAEAKVMPSGTFDCSKYNCFTTENLNQEFLEAGKYGEILDERDGQVYKTIQIGTQTWMAENLNYAYTDVFYKRDNYTSDSTSWCYDNDPANCAKYGRLYTWAAAMDSLGKWSKNGKKCGYIASCSPTYPVRGICPKGWHLPSKQEFGTLITAVGDSSTNGTVLKSTDGWSNHGNGTDAFGFSALPAGARSDGHYVRRGSYAYFWSSNDTKGISHDAYRMYLYCGEDIAGLIYDNKNHGASVRCVKDSN